MDLVLFVKGIVAGFVIAAPVGPVGILCAQRTLTRGLPAGVVAGLGGGIADAIFGAVAAFGLTFVADFLLRNESYMRLVGGLLMLAIGIYGLVHKMDLGGMARRTRLASPKRASGMVGDVVTTFVLSITNPVTILSVSPVFLGLNAVCPAGDRLCAATLVTGVFAGSMLWWALLCTLTSLFRSRLSNDRMRLIHRISSILVLILGVLVLLSVTDFGQRWLGIERR
jgi:threonine/homoserine/homoserine lactone efflux protein